MSLSASERAKLPAILCRGRAARAVTIAWNGRTYCSRCGHELRGLVGRVLS